MPKGPRPDQPRAVRGTARPAAARASSARGGSGPLGPGPSGSDRVTQVAAEVRRAVQAEIARGLNDPRVQGIVSVTQVDVLPDGTEARIRVSVLPAERASLTLSGLRAAAGFLRRRVMDETMIGRVPRLLFEVDERLKLQSALDAALRAEGVVPDGQEPGTDGATAGPARPSGGPEEPRSQ